jgi:hypothetical protein
MQIHLFECKSTVPLRRGLGKNKLNLCMLVLTQLRSTYWSASVIYRLFERAQIMLDKVKTGTEPGAGTENWSISQATEPQTTREVLGIEHHHQFPHHQDTQQEHENPASGQAIPRSNLQFDDCNAPSAFWLNDSGSPCFSNVDHLLSPGFYVPGSVFQPFYQSFDDGSGMLDAYDHYTMSMPL